MNGDNLDMKMQSRRTVSLSSASYVQEESARKHSLGQSFRERGSAGVSQTGEAVE